MRDSSDCVSIDIDSPSLDAKEYVVRTRTGCASVSVYGDQDKPALVTYPDLALNHMSCFQGLFLCQELSSLLLHNFCIYHISPPGHELGAARISPDEPLLSSEDLADQVAEVLNYFCLGRVMCMGVTAGAYILTLFATKYRQCVIGLILISPLCKEPSWTEWLYNKVISNLLYYYGMCGVVKELLLKRYFGKDARGSAQVPESDGVQACRRLLDERHSLNVWRFLEALNGREDISEGLKKLQCRSLIFVGEHSPFHSEALHMMSKLDRRYTALVEVRNIPISHHYLLCAFILESREEAYSALDRGELSGSIMRVSGDRGAAPFNDDAHGVLSHGIWHVQTIQIERQSKKSFDSTLHLSRTSIPRKHGREVKTN